MIPAKKNPLIDPQRHKALYTSLGLVIALGLVVSAFEVKSYEESGILYDQEVTLIASEEVLLIPPTVFVPPPPTPIIQEPELKEVPDNKEIKKEIEITKQEENPQLNNTSDIKSEHTIVITDKLPINEDLTPPIHVAEEQPEPEGGYPAFYEYVKKNLKYPSQARRQNIQGKVYVSFVVERDGSLSDVKITRGIGGGCDEEAERVLKNAPKWKPGKQRHQPVRVRMSIPIGFQLN